MPSEDGGRLGRARLQSCPNDASGARKTMSLFPMFVKLEGRSCLVVGAGTIGESKIRSLLVAGASVRVVAPRANAVVSEWARAGVISWEARDFNAAAREGAFLVVRAASSTDVDDTIFGDVY